MKSKRLTPKTTSAGVEVEYKKCRKCREDKRPTEFYNASDLFLDTDGLHSICKSCCNSVFDAYLESEKTIEGATLKTCRALNFKYSEEAISATLSHLNSLKEKGKIVPHYWGIYKFKLSTTLKGSLKDRKTADLTFQEVTKITISDSRIVENQITEDISELARFWGNNYDKEDLLFLDAQLFDWKKDYSCSNKGEEFILMELCYKSLELKKARIEGRSTDNILKSAQDIMKSGALTPAQANSLSDKNTSTFGVWLKEISELRPEEWVENKSIYRDVDNIEDYNERIIISPMRALVTGSKEFTLEPDDSMTEEEGE